MYPLKVGTEEGMTTTTAFDTAQGQVIYHQQRQAGGNTYENVDILRVHPHQVNFHLLFIKSSLNFRWILFRRGGLKFSRTKNLWFLYFSLLQLHDVHFVHPMVGAEVPGGVGAGGKPGGELAYYTTTLPHHHHPQVCPLTQTFYSCVCWFGLKR